MASVELPPHLPALRPLMSPFTQTSPFPTYIWTSHVFGWGIKDCWVEQTCKGAILPQLLYYSGRMSMSKIEMIFNWTVTLFCNSTKTWSNIDNSGEAYIWMGWNIQNVQRIFHPKIFNEFLHKIYVCSQFWPTNVFVHTNQLVCIPTHT